MVDRMLLESLRRSDISASEAMSLVSDVSLPDLMRMAASKRDEAHGRKISYSRKVFIPLTQLCRDVCHYCTFAHPPQKGQRAYLTIDEVLAIARAGREAGCKEALFTLGDKPELRYRQAERELHEMGFASTLAYLQEAARVVFCETGLLPHLNPGLMEADDIAALRKVSISQGIMLESASARLCEPGGPHFGSPDKEPGSRLRTIELAGQLSVPFTSGLLIGIGETPLERISSLLALRNLDESYGHIQEVIIQNFKPKPDTRMRGAAAPTMEEHLWTIALARLLFRPDMNIQAPPNLSPGVLDKILAAGINDWGGVSPVTPDHVNPEAPWPHLARLSEATVQCGKTLVERLAVYPPYARQYARWTDMSLQKNLLGLVDGHGWPRRDEWCPGARCEPPAGDLAMLREDASSPAVLTGSFRRIVAKAHSGARLDEAEIVSLFEAEECDFTAVCRAADELRRSVNGDSVSYVVNRNINYTNICYFRCQFCAFSKGKLAENLRGRPYDISMDEIGRRAREAWERGATEVCMQGGIHPAYTGAKYLEICRTVKQFTPEMHIHAFSPLEVFQGAKTLGVSVDEFLRELKDAGLGTLPGTAAEILDDEVRAILCPDKINTAQWLQVMAAAHRAGLRSTATIMFGHVDRYEHWAKHLLRIRDLQTETGGFTEFVPLPFVHMEAPIYLKGRSRKGPTFREVVLMHAIGRLVFHTKISNIQTSWVKLGEQGIRACLEAGVNDLGGTLMDETISRSAGAQHGHEMAPKQMEELIRAMARLPRQRTTLYGEVADARYLASLNPPALTPIVTGLDDHREVRNIPRSRALEMT
ncbi:5-amino-6-(D-ribitylamino)uracil--L-tyrosine 4-hydroxyphenyl transferase CofH [Bradyrhizobium sp. NBAIM03]|uniref:5-amino-6-(D-ribitylamino)uracil--L-tyrosine 4-hydroxyphenyl transferase CofH n=1 Tax=unclassified Bradyrhizobium TaxID=2631580 RepID=UPI001CD667C8|nr:MULTISPECIES: 5-amino-6-(D-ribitylamino)uracil--L-tyrosine 4-hydroxyphenyl transferase CofH [unclassified Bradyrhizobium]MCA1471110.1 5-amino-6-(D-ribitylamino)uracil--L-tyrosine 4-hydroxyphenyl transferase CofH [Bradyrhizobium sp. IC3195]MCA1536792.1 5-amino-6-(D-ribitylamino)uracil--L-tyrosine 4-hydroxyphenyl transferase CofH [Bradyrhizobium sp. NBAIM03]MCA1551605.1 5-amino-6-(D-ribitylamino)uracil--L-tyrosine 4-hydroxyphenyl transferase CofH [Bradyrhizobium sp. BRP19]